MTKLEHLLTILAEECSEVAQRVSKALRFGVGEIQPGQPLTNAERIEEEMSDLIGVWNMLRDEGVVRPLEYLLTVGKKRKVEKYLAFSAGRGLVDDMPEAPEVPHPESPPEPKGAS
jgi:NTP pyrophosphatase (non-canonical NTP hydrolase)